MLGSISEGSDSVGGAGRLVGGAENLEENEAKRRQVIGRQRCHRGRGLSFLASDVVDKFTKVAVSKLKVSSKEQVCLGHRALGSARFTLLLFSLWTGYNR